jgi:hypothetical protein
MLYSPRQIKHNQGILNLNSTFHTIPGNNSGFTLDYLRAKSQEPDIVDSRHVFGLA